MTRFRSDEEYQAAIEDRAREIWEEREDMMFGRNPHFARQAWEDASYAARLATIAAAKADLRKGTEG